MILNDRTSSSVCLQLSLFPISTFRLLYPHQCLQFSPIHTWLTNMWVFLRHRSFFDVPDSYNQLFTKCSSLDISKALQAQHTTKLNSLFPAPDPTSIVVLQCDYYQGMTKAPILASEAEISGSSLTHPSLSPQYLLQNHILFIWLMKVIFKLPTSHAWMQQ